MCGAREWKLAQVPPSYSPSRSTIHTPVMQLPPGMSLCNSDAAWDTCTKKAGLGLLAKQIRHTRSWDPLPAALSPYPFSRRPWLFEKLSEQHSLFTFNVWMRSGSQVLVRAVNSKSYPMEFYGVLIDVEFLSSSFRFFLLTFIPRDQNSLADSLAKFAPCIEPATLLVWTRF